MNVSGIFTAVSDVGIKVIIVTALLALLPESPFVHYVNLTSDIPFLQYLNWFLPITDILLIVETWLIVVTSYYGILFGLRFTGIVKG